MDWVKLYKDHISQRQNTYEKVMAACQLDAIIVGAGPLRYFFEDDMAFPYRPYHHFAHWGPMEGENHMIVVRPGKKPTLLFYAPQDFWHEYKPLGQPFWLDSFDLEEYDDAEKIWQRVAPLKNTAYIGPQDQKAADLGLQSKVQTLKERLNWHRSFKSQYEVECTAEANSIGAKGHLAAKEAFLSGGSELEIHYAYIEATGLLEREMPYETIIGLNEKGATLHYHHKRTTPRKGASFLIDAGATFRNYCSDITRTHCAPHCSEDFKQLVKEINEMQLEIGRNVRPGKSLADLHHESHMGLAKILLSNKILQNIDVDTAIDQGITRAFYPHGLGHMLGIFVHDVAGLQKDEEGTPSDSVTRYPKLRSTRKLEEGNIFTVEPGLYFIDMLLNPFREGQWKQCFNWGKIEALKPFGGIRIEDDVYVTKDGVRNLTRPYLP